MRVLVTGGAGYIGSHTCKGLAQVGHEPIVFDSLFTGHEDQARWGPFVRGDIRSKSEVIAALNNSRAEGVIHFAARAYVGESVIKPSEYYDVNVAGTLTLLDAMRETGVSHLVFSSSCATYGVPQQLPIKESDLQQPVNPYGWTKLICERAIRDYAVAYGLGFAILRYFNAAGCDPDGQLQERHSPETHLIPLALAAALGHESALRIYGTDYATPDGTPIRDYVHVSDLATAHLQALEHIYNGKQSVALNLGTGSGHSVLEIVGAIERLTGLNVPWLADSRRAGDPPILIADGSLARETIGFAPKHSSLSEIILTAFEGAKSIHAPVAKV